MASTSSPAKTCNDIDSLLKLPALIQRIGVFQGRPLFQRIPAFFKNPERILVPVELRQRNDLDMLSVKIGLGFGQDVIRRGENFIMVVNESALKQRAQGLRDHFGVQSAGVAAALRAVRESSDSVCGTDFPDWGIAQVGGRVAVERQSIRQLDFKLI